MTSEVGQELTLDPREEDVHSRLRLIDAEAWQAYAGCVQQRESMQVRRRAFDVAMRALETLADFERVRSGEKVLSGA